MDETNTRRITLRQGTETMKVVVAPANSVSPVVGEEILYDGKPWVVERNEPCEVIARVAFEGHSAQPE